MVQRGFLNGAGRRQLLLFSALPAIYLITGRLGLLLAVPPGYATAIFLPAGIAAGAVFIAGMAMLPGIFAGSLLLNIWVGYLISPELGPIGVAAAFVIAFASALQAAIGGITLRRAIGYPAALSTPRNILLFLVLSPAFCATSASLSFGGMWALGTIPLADLPMNWVIWWVGDTLGVLVAVPQLLVLAGEPRALWRRRAPFVLIPMLLSLALFVSIFIRVSRWENDQSLLEFRLQSQQFADTMKASLEEQALFLEQLSGLFASERLIVSRNDFRGLTQKLLRRFPSIQSAEWAPRVGLADRSVFERQQQADLPGFKIREGASSGRPRPAADRDQFYPVTYLNPLSGNEDAVGFDLASETRLAAAIRLAISNGNVAATAPIPLVQEDGGQAGMLLVDAVPAGPNGPGIVLAVLRIGSFTATHAEPLTSALRARFIDEDAAQALFENFSASGSTVYETRLDFGARHYIVQTTPSISYLAQHRGLQSWGVLTAGILGTGLLGAFLLLRTSQSHLFQSVAGKPRESEDRLRLATDAVHFGYYDRNLMTGAFYVSSQIKMILGYAPDAELAHGQVMSHFHPDDRQIAIEAFRRACDPAGDGQVQVEPRIVQTSGDVRWMSVHGQMLFKDGKPERSLGFWMDITGRKRQEEQIRLLLKEVNHRSKNMLTIVQAIARQTVASHPTEFIERFIDRISALASSQDLLTQSGWTGATIHDVVRSQLGHLDNLADSKILLEGADIVMNAAATQAIGMAVHELATNAAKFGALSRSGGRVEVSWHIERLPGANEAFTMEWRENGGPEPSESERKGFGTAVITSIIEGSLDGKATLAFEATGLRWLFECPASEVLESKQLTPNAKQ